MASSNPLIAALPPATDYLSYLTIVEYNLTADNLPILHNILQDVTLTENIGWDLVHLLLPLLPASNQCLQHVARFGNPREVILKVTESLREIDHDKEAFSEDEPVQDDTTAKGPPLAILQFTSLTSMLSTLHSRIKTQRPSRFFSASLQAVLASLFHSVSHHQELVTASIDLIKSLHKPQRPQLPPRKSGTNLPSRADPEAELDSESRNPLETEIQCRLLQSFLTHVIEIYVLSLHSDSDAPGLAYSARLHERLYPERTVKGKKSLTALFDTDRALHARLDCMRQLVDLARDLGISTSQLLESAQAYQVDAVDGTNGEDEPPATSSDIPLSRNGALLLFTDRVTDMLAAPHSNMETSFSIWPEHAAILTCRAGQDPDGVGSAAIGSEPEGVLDAILALALLAVDRNHIGQPADSTDFNRYLQTMSLISSNSPSPCLRYQAYYLTTTILRSNPSDMERLSFIQDTLEHCPFDNLKVAAVSWTKGEIIEANPPTAATSGFGSGSGSGSEQTSIFATPLALETLSPSLFPDLSAVGLTSSNVADAWDVFEQNLPFYLASLNLYFLLLSAKHLHKALALPSLHVNNDIAGSFLQPLRDATAMFRAASETGKLTALWEDEVTKERHLGQLKLIEFTVEKVSQAVPSLNDT